MFRLSVLSFFFFLKLLDHFLDATSFAVKLFYIIKRDYSAQTPSDMNSVDKRFVHQQICVDFMRIKIVLPLNEGLM